MNPVRIAAGWKIAWGLSIALLLFSGVVGVYNGLTEWGEGRTWPQHLVTAGVFMYGLFGLATAYGLIRRQRWSVVTAIVWAIAVAYVPGLAVMAYGGDDAILISAIAASAGSALIALGVVWTSIALTRSEVRTGPAR